jgi:hypothetical protein
MVAYGTFAHQLIGKGQKLTVPEALFDGLIVDLDQPNYPYGLIN